MKLSAPTNAFFYASVVLAVLGVLGQFVIAALSGVAFWLLLLGFVVLFIGVVSKGA